MRGSLRIGRIAGIPIAVHWSFSLLVVLVVVAGIGGPASQTGWWLVWIVALFASVTLHELAHCAVAVRKGLVVRGIVLLPIGGISEISGLPGPPEVEWKVAAAGPLASVGLAVVFGLVAVGTGAHLWPPSLIGGSWWARLAWLNVLLAGFNMLPALPMDGGRVLRAVLAKRRGELAATETAAVVAQVLAVAMIVGGLLFDLWLVLIGAFVLIGANAERRSAVLGRALGDLRVGDVMAKDQTAVPAAVTVGELGDWLARYPQRALPVTDGGRVVGIVSMRELVGRSPQTAVGAVCDRTAPIFEPATPLYPAVVEVLSTSPRDEFAVADQGLPVGVLYRLSLAQLVERAHRDEPGATGRRAA